MKKFTLEIGELRVDSFETTSRSMRGEGTVFAASAESADFTCADATCGASGCQGGTCGGCNFTAGIICITSDAGCGEENGS